MTRTLTAILLAGLLAGCVTTKAKHIDISLPEIPADIVVCFEKQTRKPVGKLTKGQIIRLIARLRRSEIEKTNCGKRLIGFYENIRAGFNAN